MTEQIASTTVPQSPRQALAISAVHYTAHEFLHIPLSACRHYADEAISISYGEMDGQITAASDCWGRTGVNGRVALMLENRPEFFIHWLALNALGISVIPLNHEMPDDEIPYYLEHGEAVAICAVPAHLPRLQGIVKKHGLGIEVITPDTVGELKIGETARVLQSDLNAECALLYTSGSTGKPKGCVLNNDYFLQQGYWYDNLKGLATLQPGKERLLTPLPLSHMNAMSVSSMAMIMTGGCLIQLDRFHPSTWWQTVREARATALHYLGVLPAILLDMPEQDNDWIGDTVRFGFGAGVNPKHHLRFEERFGFPLLEAWAMTECGAGGAIIANHEPRHIGSCCFGKPNEQIEWQLVDENKQPVAMGEPGELRVRAAGESPRNGYFSGYLKNPEATAEAWQDGWLNTGDVVRELPDGALCFVDRRKNVIRRSGENISALEVEAVVNEHPAVSVAVATAVPDDMRGDEVALVVVANHDYPAEIQTAQAIQDFALNNLVYFKAPGWVVFIEQLPVTASNKPKRADIKALAKAALENGQAVDLRSTKKRRHTP